MQRISVRLSEVRRNIFKVFTVHKLCSALTWHKIIKMRKKILSCAFPNITYLQMWLVMIDVERVPKIKQSWEQGPYYKGGNNYKLQLWLLMPYTVRNWNFPLCRNVTLKLDILVQISSRWKCWIGYRNYNL